MAVAELRVPAESAGRDHEGVRPATALDWAPRAAAVKRPRGPSQQQKKMDRLLDWMITEQERTGETDRAYAERRHLSYSHYANAKAGRRKLTREMVERMCTLGTQDICDAYVALCLKNYGLSDEGPTPPT